MNFFKLASATLNYNYSGDPLKLTSFIDSVELLESVSDSADTKTLLVSFVKTKLEGNARECLPEKCDSLDQIKTALRSKIKPDGAKVVEGRMLALRLDRNSVQDFTRKAEELSDAFRRALVVEGIPSTKADELTIDKTIELCRANTNSSLVKAVLASSKFESAKQVIAKMVTESNLDKQEKQVLAYNQYKNYNNNKQYNKHNNRNMNPRKNYQGYNQNQNKKNYNKNYGNKTKKNQYGVNVVQTQNQGNDESPVQNTQERGENQMI